MDDWRGKPYHSLNSWFHRKFGEKVYRVSIDGGFTCPNRDGTLARGGCIYCNEQGARAQHVDPGVDVYTQVQQGKEKIRQRYNAHKFLAYFQAYSGTYAAPDKLIRLYKTAISEQDVVGVSIGTRPDCIQPAILDLLEELAQDHLVIVEYGVQTIHDSSLELINRHHSVADSQKAILDTLSRKNIHVLAHLIMGIPGEDWDMMSQSIFQCLEWGIHALKLHHLYIEKNTPLSLYRKQNPFPLLKRDSYIDFLCKVLPDIPGEIVIHRFFGQCGKQNLEGPAWTEFKNENLELLEKTLEERGIRQGDRT